MSSHKNRVKMTVSGTPGTGTITLSSASSGYQSFAAAYGADATVDILILEGTAWEIARNCAYTNSGTTVSRGTLEASSTGSAVSFTSAATVEVIATADSGRRWDAAALGHSTVTGTSGAITAEVNTLYVADMSGWTADRTLTLPATAAVGDRVGLMVSVGDDAYEWLVTAASGDTLNGVSGGTEWSRVFITGEVLILRCIDANATWVVEHDGRIACHMVLKLTTNESGTKNANTWYAPTAVSGAWTAQLNVGSCADTSASKFIARRAGNYATQAYASGTGGLSDGARWAVRVWDGTSWVAFAEESVGSSATGQMGCAGSYSLAAGGYYEMTTRSSEASKYAALSYTWFSVQEVL